MPRHHPKVREVLGCDFRGFSAPEMCKRRPVVVLSYSNARPGLAIVVPLSTTPPKPRRSWHHQLSTASQWDRRPRWAKCDMLYALSLGRLFFWQLGRDADGKRKTLRDFRITEEDLAAVHAAVLAALNIQRS